MDLNELRTEAKRLQSAEPSRAIRGFDERETRTLLGSAAKLLEAAAAEREDLERELEELRAKVGEEGAGKEAIGQALLAATRASEEMAAEARSSAERIKAEAEARAAAIVDAATKATEERQHETAAERARLEAELATARSAMEAENLTIRSELERERKQLAETQESLSGALERERARALKEVQAQADTMVADARHEVARLEDYAEQLRSLLVEGQRSFVELADAALQQVESVRSERPGPKDGELLADLRPSEQRA
ncbi:MAG TPA: DivIVA domain-containing protein [Gaiellaceae bacterium]|nr:DivIVA domain-containing protein [Gaiellaceae bacterium]